MIPSNLTERVEEVFEELGGYKEAAQILTDNEIIDCCLFNGYTDIVFPFYESFTEDIQDGLSIYTAVDLSVMGYKAGSTYSVVDKNYNVLYEDVALTTTQNNQTVHVFGLSDKDKAFFNNTLHGELVYLRYKTLEGPNVAQIIVSHRLPQSIIRLNKRRWDKQIADLLEPSETNSELLLDLSGYTNLRFFYLEGELQDNYREVDVAHNINTVTGQQGQNNDFYIVFTRSTWFTLREYSPYLEFDANNIKGLELAAAETYLENLGYLLTSNLGNGRYIFSKQIIEDPVPTSPWYVEVELQVGTLGLVDHLTVEKYRVLSLINLLGIGAEKLKRVNKAYFIKLVTQEVNLASNLDTGSNQPQPLMIRSQFKVQAKVTHV